MESLVVSASGSTADLSSLFDACTVVTGLVLGFSTVAVALTAFTRLRYANWLDLEDLLIVAAQLCFVVTAALIISSTQYEKTFVDDGRSVVSLRSLVQMIRYSDAIYSLTMIVTKSSFAVFLLKVEHSTDSYKWKQYAIIAISSIAVGVELAYLIFTFASCGVMVQSPSGQCAVQPAFVHLAIVWSFVDVITNFMFVAIATFIVSKIKSRQFSTLFAALLLSLGALGCAAACARIATQIPSDNPPRASVLLRIWDAVEAGLFITAASLMQLSPLMGSSASRRTPSPTSIERTLSVRSSYMSGLSKWSRNSSMMSEDDELYERIENEIGANKMDKVLITKTYTTEYDARWKWI